VAGWLNYFLNGENIVYGSGKAEWLGSGEYSNYFRAARNETFIAGDGADSIGGDIGNDRIYGGTGNDQAGGGNGSDRMFGEAGKDSMWGEAGFDKMFGGLGDDVLGGGDGKDSLYGGDDNDKLYGDDDADRLYGDAGRDELSGGNGNDFIGGGDGADTLYGSNGGDTYSGGKGADEINLWEEAKAGDRIVFRPGDSGDSREEADVISGFQRGSDKIVLAGFGDLKIMAGDDFRGGGKASARFINEGENSRLVIDTNGDSATDMTIYMAWIDDLGPKDFLFA
jgi:Ca2+-binding RTX toxin-like protein